jgi:hypothetical protein
MRIWASKMSVSMLLLNAAAAAEGQQCSGVRGHRLTSSLKDLVEF